MIESRLNQILQEIRQTEAKSGRKEGSVTLMAVSKLHPYDEMQEAYMAGQRLFGENHVQEVETKIPLKRPEGMSIHLIGHLQTNKVGKIVPLVDSIDSVDSLRLLQKIEAHASASAKKMEILFEYNTSGEASKSGFCSEDSLFEALDKVGEMEHVIPRGLMTVGPLGGGEGRIRQAFRFLWLLKERCQTRYPSLDFSTLSMGMSGDYKIAIEEGSTMVRIGSAIFGPRNYQASV